MSILSHQILFSPTDIQLNSTQLRLLFYMYQLSLLKGYMYACLCVCVRSVTHHRGFQSMSVPGCVCHTGSTCSLLLTNVTSSMLAGQQTTQLLFIPPAALTLQYMMTNNPGTANTVQGRFFAIQCHSLALNSRWQLHLLSVIFTRVYALHLLVLETALWKE